MVASVRVLTWNVFHFRDGAPAPTWSWGSLLLGRPVDDGVRIHLNRKLTGPMAELLRAARADIIALQEVPPAAVPEICAATGMTAVGVRTGPPLGWPELRARLGRRNPDLMRSFEGNANVLLVGPGWQVVPGSVRSLRLSPLPTILRALRRDRIGAGQALRWAAEGRRMILARVRSPEGLEMAVASLHCQNGSLPTVEAELERAVGFLLAVLPPSLPLVAAGDLNVGLAIGRAPGILARAGLVEAAGDPTARPIGIDHILHRGLEVVAPPRRWEPSEREVTVTWRGRRRVVRLSDHDPVEAVYSLRGSSSPAAPPAAP
jgi:hypothetical protein